ncbi:cytochrome b5 reductase 4 family member [Holotrichia oblita]|uniref:Cytochrome b5 reductase 4 family member n=1 Tax=Holotrichia oblita TaxID=644536 RepID=A0ACB9SLT7_HOLOL|nr:cytochrome b5 reductase 4 family member [Holotrichia oblita]
MDWIRLGSSGKDLTEVGNCAGRLTVTLKQLEEHDKEDDAWLAIRGKVYNITHYLPFHPGGPEEIMKGAGKDATNLFDQIHPWVNYDQILNKCLIGRLVSNDSDLTVEDLFASSNKPKTPTKDKQTPNSPTAKDSSNIPSNNNQVLKEQQVQTQQEEQQQPPLPRFDWIQKMDSITTIFYTKSLSNPQVEINPPNQENVIHIFLQFDGKHFVNELRFSKSIQWPCQTKINYETGKIELIFKKVDSQIWENYGTLRQRYEEQPVMDLKLKYSVINKLQVNQNTCLLELERVDTTKLTVPLGKHIRVFGKVKGEEMSRSYTPVPNSLFSKYKPQVYTSDNICLMIKSYPNGNISRFICSRNKYDVVELSRPLGTFNLVDLEQRELFLMLAGGTGLTPMLGLLSFLLERRVKKCQKVSLLFFNRTEEDILLRNQFDTLQKEDSRFQATYILSQPSPKWKGSKGHITSEVLQDAFANLTGDSCYSRKDVYVLVCGPTVFTNLAQSLLKELEVGDEQMYLFLG